MRKAQKSVVVFLSVISPLLVVLVTENDDFASFNVGLQGKDANGATWNVENVQFPAPGALALLGVAGLLARRRRK